MRTKTGKVRVEQDNVRKAEQVLRRHRHELRKRYSVSQVGVGYKTERGRISNKVVLVFYVDKKKTKSELVSEGVEPVPNEIDGIPTDIVEIRGGFEPRKGPD
ncbi:MAG TPA: hypothetical protein VGQ03_02465 [Nitrososphaera sp.]|jgi:hypothetical protein|nr:hypothetical protein [Nitrososphaera sp.]